MTNSAIRCAGAQERRERILSQLRLLGFLSITELARDLGVSHMTVRRDLQTVESSESMRLVHGGASLAPSALHGAAFPPDRLGAARGRVAALAAELVGATDTIAVDAGPTAYTLARALPESFSGSVITHSMPVVQLLAEQSTGARLVALGGSSAPIDTPSSVRARRPPSPGCGPARSSSSRPRSTSAVSTRARPRRRACSAD